jgi:micrococcal nuclease
MLMRRYCLLFSLLLPLTAAAQQCLVVGISDGDTLNARCGAPGDYNQTTVRLAEIDAPESKQAFGQRSKRYLSDLCFGVTATLRPTAKDRYGRTVARVECKGKDANAEMVKAGMAWAYTKYQTDPAFPQFERQARAAHVGLWADRAPVPPWDYRHTSLAAGPDASGCITGPKGGRYTLTSSGKKRYGC